MKEPLLTDFFCTERCNLCGDCISECPEFGEGIVDASGTMKRLIDGHYVKEVLDHCSSCMSCNTVCPYECNPYGLILYRWYERSREKGFPVRASLVMPLEPRNAWHSMMKGLAGDERLLLDRWSDLGRDELRGRAVFAGCNLQVMPYLAESAIFEGLPIYGRPDLCCGEVYYRMGAFDKLYSVVSHLEQIYREFEINEVVAYCQACYNMLKYILPKYFDASFIFNISYFGDLLAEKVLSGQLPVAGKLEGLKVTVQDPCHSKMLGNEFQERPRRVLEYMGCEVREMKHSREMSLCCGLGHGAARYNPMDMAGGIIHRLREARATGADYLVVYCNSCELLFSVGTQLTPFIIPVYHLNELVGKALGEELARRNLKRARSMVKELFIKGAPKVLSRKRFRLERI